MTIAELHGKLATDRPSGIHERMEDLLTSDVFGTMKYAGAQHGFLDWLLKAEPAPVKPSPPAIESYLSQARVTHVEYSFWPKLKNNREPDVALLFCFDTGHALLALVEAKYFSGTSDWEGDEDTNPYGLTGNQIADQVRGLGEMSKEDLLGWFQVQKDGEPLNIEGELNKIHLFITMHTLLPVNDYDYSAKYLGESWAVPCYWLSWTSLAECLKEHLGQITKGLGALLNDLYELLQRKGLVPFKGFKMRPLKISQESPAFWRERWWSPQQLRLKAYHSFWHEVFWQAQPMRHFPNGCFWERR